jgi:D-alanine-D-alanine ligase
MPKAKRARAAVGGQGKLRVGLTFNLRAPSASEGAVDEETAEYDSPATIAALRAAIESHGHEVLELEAKPDVLAKLHALRPDVVFNLAEGGSGRARETQVPALLELLGIPYTGSDPTAIGIALDKVIAKKLVAYAGLPTPAFVLMSTGREPLPKGMRFPVIAKPFSEGSSRGVTDRSVAESERQLRKVVREQLERYRQPVLVEAFLPGREFTIGLLGDPPRALLPMEVCFTNTKNKHPVYGFDNKFYSRDVKLVVPAKVSRQLGGELARLALACFAALGCRDVGRVDLRLDARGKPSFIECNPLPGLAPGFSDLCVIAEASGVSYRQLIGETLAPALLRMKQA